MDLENFLKKNKLWYKFLDKPETVHTADAAKATGIELHRVTKNLVSTTNTGEHVLLIVLGDRKVDLRAAAQALNVQNVRLIPFDQAEGISGYPPGGTPSIGHKSKMRAIVDESILQYETVYCGGGSRERMLELKSADIVRLNNAIIAKIAIQ
jgi:Cys-tRNA(Pro)/Cys-tRNA(Cys) deacylase